MGKRASRIACWLILFSPTVCLAQRYENHPALKPRADGALLAASATIAVCTQPANTGTTPCSPLATLYTDASLSVACNGVLKDGTNSAVSTDCSNPLITDARGNYHFYAAGGPLTIQIYGSGISTSVEKDILIPVGFSTFVAGNCVQAGTGGQLSTAGGPCGTSSGTVTVTGSPVNGNMTKFSSGTSITNGDLSGDVSTSGGLVTTLAGTISGGHAFTGLISATNPTWTTPTISSPVINGSSSGTGVQGTDSKLMTSGTVSGTAQFLCTDANGGATTSGCTVIQKIKKTGSTPCTTGSSSYNNCTDTLTWPVSFGSTSYAANCTGVNTNINGGSEATTLNIDSYSSTTVTVVTQTQRSQSGHYQEIHCIGIL